MLSIRSICKACPLKKECCGNKRRQSLTFSVYRHYHKQMQERVESKEGKRMKGQRMATVEPVFGSLLNYYGMKRSNAKGKQAAHKFMLNLLRVCIGFGPLPLTTYKNCSFAFLTLNPMLKFLLYSRSIPRFVLFYVVQHPGVYFLTYCPLF
jgi:hypothetical protein